ncbi:MAG: tRNA (adenosine(37)-N6)-threonylcarbamoyltransferase complex ATPase subunit type 1 TsaE [Chloroflexota bacterium]
MARDQAPLTLTSGGPAGTRRLGQVLGEMLQPGDVVLLDGEFGAGKTVFAQGVGRGLGVVEYVTSPSFTLVNEYRGRLTLYHVDLYRVEKAQEALELGLQEMMGGEGVCLVEWPQAARALAGGEFLLVRLSTTGASRRRLQLEASGSRHAALLEQFARAVG